MDRFIEAIVEGFQTFFVWVGRILLWTLYLGLSLVVLGLFVALVVFFVRRQAARHRESRTERLAETEQLRRRAAADAKQETEGQAWVEERRRDLAILKGEVERDPDFLDERVSYEYARDHHHRILTEWPAKLALYDEWIASREFGYLVRELGAQRMVEVWKAKKRVYADAQRLSVAELKAWEGARLKEFKEAAHWGLPLDEYRQKRQHALDIMEAMDALARKSTEARQVEEAHQAEQARQTREIPQHQPELKRAPDAKPASDHVDERHAKSARDESLRDALSRVVKKIRGHQRNRG